MSKAHEIRALVAQYIQTRDPGVLDEAPLFRHCLTSTRTSGRTTGRGSSGRSRTYNAQYLEIEIIRLTLLSYKKLWPPYKELHITREEVSKISAGLRKAKINLAYALAKLFIGEAVERHRKNGTSNLPSNSIAAQDCVAAETV
ncbi:MAG: hypothetical protein Q9198_000295 [Flavoplaca austrocitrina]